MPAPIVYFDIAGPERRSLQVFYSKVFGWEFDDAGQFTVSVASPLQGTIRPDPPEKRIYLGVPDVNKSLERVVANGGSLDTPRFEVPGVAVLGLFKDPAGNEMGLVEMEGDAPRIP